VIRYIRATAEVAKVKEEYVHVDKIYYRSSSGSGGRRRLLLHPRRRLLLLGQSLSVISSIQMPSQLAAASVETAVRTEKQNLLF
jgi:hypothetical protein